MHNDFELYNVHAQSDEKVDYVVYNGKVLLINKVKFHPTLKVNVKKGYRQIKG